MNTNSQIIHGYFAVTGVDMWGGDLQGQRGYTNFEEALIQVKKGINFDESKCGVIFRRKDKQYEFYIKSIHKTNPSKAQNFLSFTNVFYGKRSYLSKEIQKNKQTRGLVEFDYYTISRLDLYGADIETEKVKGTFEEALQSIKETINYDNTKCGVIYKQCPNQYTSYFKDIKRTNPSKSTYHQNSVTVFFGRTV